MEAGVMGSYAQMVCDSEFAASVRRLRRGFAADEDAVAVEVVAAAMDGTRNFLAQRHTTRYLRSGELLMTPLAERRSWETWDHSGRENMAERAQSQAEKILAEHQVEPLSPAQEHELDAIMAEAKRILVEK
jgi:trimethylamine---corrinoid protein Co-methyltransferase